MKASGIYEFEDGRRCFRPFVPEAPPLAEVIDRLEAANRALQEFDFALARLSIPGTVGKLFARLDAVHSSGVEGSTTTFTDLLEFQSSLGTARDAVDAAAVAACAEAFVAAESEDRDPLDVVTAIHRRLFEQASDPMVAASAGRLKQRVNSTLDRDEPGGIFCYTAPASLEATVSEWRELTLRQDAGVPQLVLQGLSHWMFEHIHPVADGNGRIGRLLIPLMLRRAGVTRTACAFIGEAVHEDKDLYLDALKAARRTGCQVPWIRVFLTLVARNARANLTRLDRLAQIQSGWVERLASFRRNSAAHRLVPWMLTNPAFTVKDAALAMDVSYQGMNGTLNRLVEEGLLDIAGGARRDRLFQATAVLDLFDRFRPSHAPGSRW